MNNGPQQQQQPPREAGGNGMWNNAPSMFLFHSFSSFIAVPI
jgi:hypothetical protein